MKKSAKKAGKNSKIVTKNNKKLPVVEEKPVVVEEKPVIVEEIVAVAEEAPLETEVKDDAPVQEETDEEIAEPAANDSEAPASLSARVPLLYLPPEPTYRQLLGALSALLERTLFESTPNKVCEDLILQVCELYGVEPPKEMLLVYMVPAINAAIEVYNGRN